MNLNFDPMTITGLISEAEGSLLRKLAARPDPPGCILEIGAFHGRSTLYLAQGAVQSGRKVYTIDYGQGNPDMRPGHYAVWGPEGSNAPLRENLARAGADHVELIVSGSLDAAESWSHGPIAGLFHDASHDRESVGQDLRAFQPYLADRAWVAAHDFGGSFPGVQEGIEDVWPDWRERAIAKVDTLIAWREMDLEIMKKEQAEERERILPQEPCPTCGGVLIGVCGCTAIRHASCAEGHVWVLGGGPAPDVHRRIRIGGDLGL